MLHLFMVIHLHICNCSCLRLPVNSVGHVETGRRTYNIYSPFPEKFNCQAVGLVSKFNFAQTIMSRNNLCKEGKDPDRV